ncbi:schwannomin-interacting protein 1-like protein [Lates japonicus]|uniref:Schwannomin-interacting protein 1-like protein n=1 Tax=Lates japonicus TaxID=270547 RepID=A0AAD3NAS6_LATJO|nr:schwannomin-interacting protein 1-like protein [Lates japonicus]
MLLSETGSGHCSEDAETLSLNRRKERLAGSSGDAKRKHLERWELQECSMQQLSSLRASLQQDVHVADERKSL